ncbi:MAG: hypothetical protein HY930_02810 [Euryarchaeota archaeon]|nr:hypothetical protein [Euryarchaeota archaeon]
MNGSIGFIKRSEIAPEGKDSDVCAECRAAGLNICDADEICQLRLANALGKSHTEIATSIDYARKKGLIDVRYVKFKGSPKRFIRITEQGRMFFGSRS